MDRSKPTVSNFWTALRRFTPARIALGRAGAALPTEEVLAFGLAHARARDAVHEALDVERLEAELHAAEFETIQVHSAAPSRRDYLLRPDLGRRLSTDSVARLRDRFRQPSEACTSSGSRQTTTPAIGSGAVFDVCLVVADGLSSIGMQRHAVPLLQALRERAPAVWAFSPVILAEQARVALGDEIGELLRARIVAILIGERPGLSSPDSLGIYLTYEPRVGRNDSERNCISNIRPEGLTYTDAARKALWLIDAALRRRLTGVALKDESDLEPLSVEARTAIADLSSDRKDQRSIETDRRR